MKRICVVLVLIITLYTPSFAEAAANDSDTLRALTLQVDALTRDVARTSGGVSYTNVSSEEIQKIITDATKWLITAQEADGHFAYEYAPYEGEYLRGDNIVRQAGTLFALGEVYKNKKTHDGALAKSITQSISFFTSLKVAGKEGDTSFVCIGSTEKKRDCKLGAVALALIGVLDYVEETPEARKKYESLISGYTAFILTAQKESGGFRDLYRVEDGFVNKESPFSNGEALLALVRAYQYQEDERVKGAIDDAFSYLTTTEHVNPLYLWIMAALKDMNRLWPNDEYVAYARDFTTWRMKNAGYPKQNHNYCPYVEGLVSAYSVLKAAPHKGELLSLRTHIDSWHSYHRTLQVDASNPYKVLFEEKGASIGMLADALRAHGGFLTAHLVPTERIDFTQHCVSAYLQTLVDIDGEILR